MLNKILRGVHQIIESAKESAFMGRVADWTAAIGSLIFAGFFLQIGMYLAERLFW